jgi:hypothetical protein
VPQQPLLGDGLGDEPPEARDDALPHAPRGLGRLVVPPLERLNPAAHARGEAREDAALPLGLIGDRVLWRNLAVELVPIGTDRDQEHVHARPVR